MRATKPSGERTLFGLGTLVGLILLVLAAADLLRGTGGRVWLSGVVGAEETHAPGVAASSATRRPSIVPT